MKLKTTITLIGVGMLGLALSGCGASGTKDHGGHSQPSNSGQSDMDKMKAELAKLAPADTASAKKQHVCPASEKMLGTLRLLEFAVLTFSPKKVFHYLGRKWHEQFDGEVQTHYKSVRDPGVCVKHYLRNNWLKMYDKLGLILRVETVINQPGEFKVFRERRHRDGSASSGWYPMCKGVGNFHHYQSHALSSNQRYLEALAGVDDPAPAYDDLRTLTDRQRQKGRSYAGFNPARVEEARLFAAVLAGDHIAQGFRNKDIRLALQADNAPGRHRTVPPSDGY